MASFIPGPLISSITGTVGGLNFAKGRSAPYVRRTLARTNSQTPAQLARRAYFALISQTWQKLDVDVRAAWHHAASQVFLRSPQGTAKRLTGAQFYTQYQAIVFNPLDFPAAPPTTFKHPAPPQPVTFDANEAGAIDITWFQFDGPADYFVMFFASQPISSKPRQTFKNFKLFYTAQASGTTPTVSLVAAWNMHLIPLRSTENIALRFKVRFPGWLDSLPATITTIVI